MSSDTAPTINTKSSPIHNSSVLRNCRTDDDKCLQKIQLPATLPYLHKHSIYTIRTNFIRTSILSLSPDLCVLISAKW